MALNDWRHFFAKKQHSFMNDHVLYKILAKK